MTLIISAVGFFYLLAACLVLRRAYAEMRAVKSANGTADGARSVLMTLSACLYAAAGAALLLLSSLAVWLFAAGLALQLLNYGLIWRSAGSAETGVLAGNQALTGGMLSAAAIALSAYALRTGLLT